MSKTVFHHPEGPDNSGRKYWKSVEQYSDTPEFRQWLEREFPAGASEMENDGLSRRSFVQLMGASLALAGLGLSGCRRPEAHIVPFTKAPEWLVPGRYLHYSSSMPRRRGATPLLVTTYNGRPTKIEGHPGNPIGLGKTDSYAQASILDMYDPDRSRGFRKKDGKKLIGVDSSEFYTALEKLRADWLANKGEGLAILADENLSPSRDRLRDELRAQFPNLTWVSYEPLLSGEDSEAQDVAFGAGIRQVPEYSKARIILSLDNDFLSNDEGGLKASREFASARRVEKPGDVMNRLYAVENRFTNTGAMADHRLRIPASRIGGFTLALAQEIVSLGKTGNLPALISSVGGIRPLEGVDPKWIKECAADLVNNTTRSLVLVGLRQPAAVQLLVAGINQALASYGNTLRLVQTPKSISTPIESLAEKIRNGKISSLVIFGANPVYNAPANLKWSDLQKSIPNVVHHGLFVDETAAASTWHVPAAHYLESWGDALGEDGSYLAVQPMILPLFGGISQLDLLTKMLGKALPDGTEVVKETFRIQSKTSSFALESAWNKFLHDGFIPNSSYPASSASFNANTAANYIASHKIITPTLSEKSLEIVFAADYSMDDGRYNNNAWMQEWPDPITKMTWENGALISPTTAKKLGVDCASIDGIVTGDKIKIRVNDREIEAPVMIAPGHADNSITLPLGYGRTTTGRVGDGSGFNAYLVRTSETEYFAVGATIAKSSGKHPFGVTQDHFSMEGRALAREGTLEAFNHDPKFAKKLGIDSHVPPNKSFYQTPENFFSAPHQWAMTIDLTTCTGCNACVVACQAENNIPVVGKEQVKRGREMHWIRIDRYFTSATDYNQDKGELPSDPQVLMQPVACQQCDNAPCETVCPVNATVHNEEGLNVMAYNRCIGTRYCSNNCPYKVRRFNFFDFNQRPNDYAKDEKQLLGFINSGKLYQGPLAKKGMEETLKLQKNPNVTVRMRGVMEKCTFCVQRIEAAKIDTLVKAGASPNIVIPANSLQVACQQACPSDAIVFGNRNNPESRVSKMLKLDQGYELLSYLNTKPRITYLARIRNPNMKMPDAAIVGMSSLKDAHHGGGEHGSATPHEGGH